MFPVLFRVFDVAIPSYSVMMVLGFAAALYVVMLDVRKDKDLLRWQAWDLFIVMVVASVLGSKLGHVLFESEGHLLQDGSKASGLIDLLRDDPLHWARLGESGYVWYGGLLGALGTAIFYFWRRPQLNGWLYSDAFAPAIAAGAVIGRLGCFLAGCCHGVETTAAWGVKFPQQPHPVHPTQLYDAAAALILFGVTFVRFPRRRFDGEVIAILLMGYAVLRAFTEAFRGDAERGGIGPFSTSQLISIPLFLAGLAIYVLRSKASGAVQRDALEKAG